MATKTITDDSFDNDVLKSSKPILVDFWAEWCGPCKQIGPVLEEISNDMSDQIIIAKHNIDNEDNRDNIDNMVSRDNSGNMDNRDNVDSRDNRANRDNRGNRDTLRNRDNMIIGVFLHNSLTPFPLNALSEVAALPPAGFFHEK